MRSLTEYKAMFNAIRNSKRGSQSLGSGMKTGISAAVVIFLVVALLPEIFLSIFELNTSAGVPTWFKTVMGVLVGAVFLFIIWRQAE